MNIFLLSTSVIALLFSASSSSQQGDKDITVKAAVLTPAQWANVVNRRLDQVLVYPQMFSNELPKSGIVSVRFRADEANRPSSLTISRMSGVPAFDRAALIAIRRIGVMPVLPTSFKEDQSFIAHILYAATQTDHDKQIKILRREAIIFAKARSHNAVAMPFPITSHADAAL